MLRRLVHAANAFGWAASLLALRQSAVAAGGCGRGGGVARRGLARQLDRLSWEAERQLGDVGREIYQAGDSLQQDLADLWLPADPCSLDAWLSSFRAAATASADSLRFVIPGQLGVDAWRELADKLQVYRLVRRVGERIGVPGAGEPFDLAALVARAYALDDYSALWAVEGLGHDYALHAWSPGAAPPAGLLRQAPTASVPLPSLTMLHAGIGLAFAQRLLGDLPPGAGDEVVRATVAEVLRLCRANSRPGYVGAALESLGLVTRTFHADRLDSVDAALCELGEPEARCFLWHGVGRALYFLPINFLPWGDTTARPFEMGLAEAPNDELADDVMAGLGWAFTLVAMRRPELMDRLLLAVHGDVLRDRPGFANGVASSLAMRQDTTPDAELQRRFLAHRPRVAVADWEQLVRRPGVHAVEEIWPRLRQDGRLGEIFRFQAWIGAVGATGDVTAGVGGAP
jgi:hypothetical protein